MLTRKYYRLIAHAIKQNSYIDVTSGQDDLEVIVKDNLISELCVIFARDNSLFSRDKFVDACND